MIQTFRSKNLVWYDVTRPTQEDIETLKKDVKLHPLVIDEMRPRLHRSKLDLYAQYLFLVLHIPFLKKRNEGVEVVELDCVIGKEMLISNHYRDIPVITRLQEQFRDQSASSEFLEQPVANLLYHILSTVLQESLAALDTVEERIGHIEKTMFTGKEREMVREISQLRRDVIDFRRATSPARPVFRALDDAGPALLGAETLHYFRNLTGRSEQIATLLKAQKETIEALEETNQALLTTATNDIFRILTVFASIALPLTLIASIFGMNVDFPAFVNIWTVLGAITVTAISMIFFFLKKKWL